uniref:Uncharacterized protein n=1 Tax=Bionectria ochroleuca TaxID=29856 RepID=A0A8H7N991_BIOOC
MPARDGPSGAVLRPNGLPDSVSPIHLGRIDMKYRNTGNSVSARLKGVAREAMTAYINQYQRVALTELQPAFPSPMGWPGTRAVIATRNPSWIYLQSVTDSSPSAAASPAPLPEAVLDLQNPENRQR